MAQKTTLVPSGIPGQNYGSFAGKVAAIVQTIEIICAGATVSLVTTTTEAVSAVTTTTGTVTGCD